MVWIKRAAFAVLGALACVHATGAQASDRGWNKASTVGEAALVGMALGLPLLEEDDGGLVQAGASIGAAAILSYGAKQAFPEWRPDHSDRRGFPSAHSAIAFSAAATLYNRHGWEVGVPAHIVAAFVATARVQAHRHRWHDVLAGAAIGELSGLLITRKQDDLVRLSPWADLHGGGIALATRF
ncbi:membrane-associated phospholipid phosphatase [Sphingobium sp. OAS761]|uniref:phosphatase PAP2 family protein n=1 Tax=Sphingobium sp. OAS761 TaxID=2817901 RepID=UPI0020A02AFB|nr:phosphatase PAP2 family protein [Sphingobium sp. OAS761]MCP1472044.1 membrane-associated phospholipid phosphatase [Sphingobium sp. OAS761]